MTKKPVKQNKQKGKEVTKKDLDKELAEPKHEVLTLNGQKKEINWDDLRKYCEFRASKETCAYMLGLSEMTISRKIRQRYDLTFEEYREKVMSKIKVQLVNKALDMAINKSDRTLLIFCLKNYCGFSDDEIGKGKHVQNFIQLNYKLD